MRIFVGRGRWARLALLLAAVVTAGAGAYLGRSWLFPGTLARGLAAYDRGDWSGASSLAAARLKESAADRDAVRLLARSSARAGRDGPARSLYARLGGAEAMHAEDFFLLGRVIDRAGDHETARACWVAGLRLDPGYAEILNEFARLYLDGVQPDLAAGVANRLASRRGWEARAALYLGRAALLRDDPRAAADHLGRALDIDPSLRGADQPPAHYTKLLARALLRTGRHGEAVRRLRTLSAADGDAETSWLLGRAALQAGDARRPETLGAGDAYRRDHPLEPEPSPYVGSAPCASCHEGEHAAQRASLHARTYRRAPTSADLPMPRSPLPDPAAKGITHTISNDGDRVQYAAEVHGQTVRAVVDFVFGSGHRGLTLVGRDNGGKSRELRLSRYADGPCWDVTSGQPALPPPGEGYLGRPLSPDDVLSCLDCHTTSPHTAREGTGPGSAEAGIGCERCHGPGGNHLKAVALEAPDPAIARPRVASSAGVVALCGQCHSPRRRAVSPADAVAPRFPATSLTWSRCYTESTTAFDCRTCHNPHRDSDSSPEHYESVCRSCHAAKPGHAAAKPAPFCPVNGQNGCVSCHMPKTKIGVPHAEFTDHFIRRPRK